MQLLGLDVKRGWIEGQFFDERAAAIANSGRCPRNGGSGARLCHQCVGRARAPAGREGIPAAIDIAIAMGVLGLLGNQVPASLRLFLPTMAIVDDNGAVLVSALPSKRIAEQN